MSKESERHNGVGSNKRWAVREFISFLLYINSLTVKTYKRSRLSLNANVWREELIRRFRRVWASASRLVSERWLLDINLYKWEVMKIGGGVDKLSNMNGRRDGSPNQRIRMTWEFIQICLTTEADVNRIPSLAHENVYRTSVLFLEIKLTTKSNQKVSRCIQWSWHWSWEN